MNTKRVLRMMAVAAAWSGAMAQAWDQTENQLWLQGSAETHVSAKLKLKVAEQIRYKDSGGEEFYHHTDLQVCRQLAKGWSLAGTYRYIDKERKNGAWLVDNMALLDLCKKTVVSGVELKGRWRGTYTDRRCTECDPTDLRFRLDLAPAKGWARGKLNPYLADELMYNLDNGILYRNRASVGLKSRLGTSLATNLYLMQDRLHMDGGGWREFFVMGGCVALKF